MRLRGAAPTGPILAAPRPPRTGPPAPRTRAYHGAMARLPVVACLLAASVGAAVAAGGSDMSLAISSTAFQPGGEIPAAHTCEGKDISPPLTFSGVPGGARSLALVVDDPDAPDPKAPRMTWV